MEVDLSPGYTKQLTARRAEPSKCPPNAHRRQQFAYSSCNFVADEPGSCFGVSLYIESKSLLALKSLEQMILEHTIM